MKYELIVLSVSDDKLTQDDVQELLEVVLEPDDIHDEKFNARLRKLKLVGGCTIPGMDTDI